MIAYNTDTPILFLIFNRPSTTLRVFSQIRKMKPSKLYIAADGPRRPEEKAVCEQVREMATAVDWDCQVFKLFRDKNLGCARAISEAIRWFFDREPEGIILEDDCLPADSFFGFCSAMLERYRDDERIGHITGGNYQGGIVRGDGSYYFSTLTHVWGWAGWRRVWKDYELRPKSYLLFEQTNHIEQLPAHKPFKNIWNHNLRVHCAGNADSWDYQYAYLNLVQRRLSIIPNTNLISNIGCSENPTHFIQNHPFADIPLSEMERIIHPTFMIADIEADIHSQNIEHQISFSDIKEDGFLFIKEKLTGVVSGKDSGLKIPRIIHQIYFDMTGVPKHLSVISQTWKEKHPAWEYRFWNQKTVEQFMESDFPDLLPLYRSFPMDVQRWDFVRYLILHRYGGLYVDMDYECLEPIDALLWNATCCMGMEPAAHALRCGKAFIIGNALMASVPGHDFFDRIIKDIAAGDWQKHQNKGFQVMESTGPFMTTRIYDGYEKKDEITLLPAELVAPLSLEEVQQLIAGKETAEMEEKVEKAFAVHYFLGSWFKQLNSR